MTPPANDDRGPQVFEASDWLPLYYAGVRHGPGKTPPLRQLFVADGLVDVRRLDALVQEHGSHLGALRIFADGVLDVAVLAETVLAVPEAPPLPPADELHVFAVATATAEALMSLCRRRTAAIQAESEEADLTVELPADEVLGTPPSTERPSPATTAPAPPRRSGGPETEDLSVVVPLSLPKGSAAEPDEAADVARTLSGNVQFPRPFGRYEILGYIDRGAMGLVYRARHVHLNRSIAIKVLPGALFTDPLHVGRLLREAKVGAHLHHPNLCQVLDAGQEGGEFYIAMELLHGQTLRDVLDRRGPLPLPEACAYTRQLVEALRYLAGQNVVHRDVKPGNLMVCPDDGLKLMDLGLAKDTDRADSLIETNSGVLLGTPSYMAPEQVHDASKVTWRSDLYAAGVILFEMVTGTKPFVGDSRPALLHQVLRAPTPDPRTQRPDLPEPLARIILGLLDKEPERRPDHDAVLGVLEMLEPSAPAEEAGQTAAPGGPADAILHSLDARLDRVARQIQDPERDDLLDCLPKEEGKPRLGNYYLEGRIGPKAVITTYRAHHFLTGTPYVIRLLPPAFSQMAPERLRALLQKQGQLMAISQRCRHLARLVDLGMTQLVEGNFKVLYYMVEDFLPGTPLEQRIAAGQPLAPPAARRYLGQTVKAVSALHGEGLVHGNLHAGKLFVAPDGRRLGLADLSLACAAPAARPADRTAADAALNQVDWLGNRSPRRRQYVAPEVLCEGEEAGPLAEQYALGVVFIEALTGRFVRTDPNDLKLVKYVREDLEDRLRELAGPAPRLARLLGRMVSMNARSRYPDLGAVRDEVAPANPTVSASKTRTRPPAPLACDVFLSWRGEVGSAVARAVVDRLRQNGLTAFEGAATAGPRDARLLAVLAAARHFVPILSQGALEGCAEADDGLRQEIAHALRTGRHVVPVYVPPCRTPEANRLPADIRPVLTCPGVEYSQENFGEFISRLLKMLKGHPA
jgi:serine/threonine protein kinase